MKFPLQSFHNGRQRIHSNVNQPESRLVREPAVSCVKHETKRKQLTSYSDLKVWNFASLLCIGVIPVFRHAGEYVPVCRIGEPDLLGGTETPVVNKLSAGDTGAGGHPLASGRARNLCFVGGKLYLGALGKLNLGWAGRCNAD